jgi:branched-chain amino acid transport system permease protein
MLLTLFSQLLNGLTVGAMYALVAAGLALTIGVLRVVNFAHGDLFMVGSYLFWYIYMQLGLTYGVSSLLTIPLMAATGVLFYLLVVRPVLRRSWQVQLVATLAASTILNNGVIWLIGSVPQTTPTDLSRSSVTLLGVTMSEQRVAVLVAAPIIFLGLHFYLKYTRTGMAMRAVSQNREAAEVAGIKIGAIATATFAIGTALIGLGNVLITPVYSVFPAMGVILTLKGFAVMIVGGYGRVNATIIAAFLLGIAEALGAGYISSGYTDAFAFVAMIIVLLLAPQGLFGRKVGI